MQDGAWALDSSHAPGFELQVHLSGCLTAWCLLNTVLRLVGVPMAEPRELGFLAPLVAGARCVTRAAPVRRNYMRHPLSSKCKALHQVLFYWCCCPPSLLALGILYQIPKAEVATSIVARELFLASSAHLSQFSSVAQLCPTLRPHEPQHARPPCPSPTPGVHPNPCPLCC